MKTSNLALCASLFLGIALAFSQASQAGTVLERNTTMVGVARLPILLPAPVFNPPAPACNSFETPTLIVLHESAVAAPASQVNFEFLAISACVSHLVAQSCTGASASNPACYNKSSLLAGNAYVGQAPWTADGQLHPVAGSVQTRLFIGTFYESKFPAQGDSVSLRSADDSVQAEGNFDYSFLKESGPGSVNFTIDGTTLPYAEVTQWQ